MTAIPALAPNPNRRPWTAAQDALLRRDYRRRPTSELMLMLGKTVYAIRHRARELKLFVTLKLDDHADTIRELHSCGASAMDIVRAIGCGRSTALRWLARLSLRPNYSKGCSDSPQHQEWLRQQRANLRGQGYRTWGAYINVRKRLKYQYEFPGCIGPSEVRVCRTLQDGGKMTVAEVAAAGGWRSARSPVQAIRQLHMTGVLGREEVRGREDARYIYFLKQR